MATSTHKDREANFFIVGAPKSGSTSLFRYLRKHPEIYMPGVKEIAFFGEDINVPYNPIADNLEEYKEWFSGREEPLLGEACVWYLISEYAAKEIKKFNPNAKIIIVLRDPTKMVHSLHSQLYYTGWEDIPDFREALDAENDRRKGKRIPQYCRRPKTLLYRELGRYYRQVKRYLDLFGRENVMVIVFKDLINKPEETCREILTFLKVNTKVNYNFPHSNENKTPISLWLRDLLLRDTKLKREIWKVFPRNVKPFLWYLIYKLNSKRVRREPIPEDLDHELREYFKKDIKKLEKLLNKNLSYWYE